MSRRVEPEISLDDVGTEIFLITDVDMSSAGSLSIQYEKPLGSTGTFSGASADQRADEQGNLRYGVLYVTQLNDIDEAGEWKLWAAATNLGVWSGRSPKPFVLRVAI